MKKTIEYIAFDADDTLWENEMNCIFKNLKRNFVISSVPIRCRHLYRKIYLKWK